MTPRYIRAVGVGCLQLYL